MPSPQPRNKRILILTAIGVFVILLVGLRFAQQQNRRDTQTQSFRDQGLAAYEVGDFETAAGMLGDYLDNAENPDAESFFVYGQAALRVAVPGGTNRAEAVRAMTRAVSLEPENLAYAHEVLTHLAPADTLTVIEEVLEANPDDPTLRRHHVLALAATGKLVDANRAAESYLEDHPLDIEVRSLIYRLRTESGVPAEALLADARALLEASPQDPRAMLAVALALDLEGDRAEAQTWVGRAAAPLPDDPSVLDSLVLFYDAMGQFESARELLLRHHDRLSPSLRRELASRLYEAGQLADLVAIVETIPSRDRTANQDGMRAIALRQLDRAAEHEAALDTLAQRKDGGAGAAWAQLIRGLNADEPADEEAAALIQAAIELDITSPVLHLLRGDALAAAGEAGEASQHYEAAAQLRPSWDAPRLRLANLALGSGDLDRANRLAIEAYTRAPRKIENVIMLVAARSRVIEPGQSDAANELLRQVEAVQQVAPDEPNTAVIRPHLLALAGQREEASAAIDELLERDPPLSGPHLLRLAQTDVTHGLGQAAQIQAVVEAAHGVSPQLTFIEAQRLAGSGDVEQGLALIDSIRPSDGTEPAWGIERARFIERFRPDDAADAWRDLAAAFPDDRGVQIAAAQSPSVAGDRAFRDATIERVRALERNSTQYQWRLLRARYLLSLGTDAGPRADAEEALDLLEKTLANEPGRVDARVLASVAHQGLGDANAALQVLESDEPGARTDAQIHYQRARLYAAMGREAEAADSATSALAGARLSPDQRLTAGIILAWSGRTQAGYAEIDRVLADESVGTQALLEYAALLQRRGDRPQVLADLVGQLEASPTPSAILFDARYHHTTQRPDAADRALARLETLGLDPLQRHQLLSGFYRGAGQPDRAIEHLVASVELVPEQAGAWRILISTLIEMGRGTDALAQTRRAAAQHPDDPAFAGLLQREGMLLVSANSMGLRDMFVAAVTDEAHRRLAFEALDTMATAQTQDHSITQIANAMVGLAERDPTFDELQRYTGMLLLAAGEPARAADIGLALMKRRPDLDSAARLAAEALLEAQRWEEALVAATQWQKTTAGPTLEPDVAIARAKLRLNDAGGALRAITPHRSLIESDPKAHPPATTALARVLVVNGQRDAAYDLLAPLARQDTWWRMQYLQLGTSVIRGQNEAIDWLLDPAGGTADDDPELRLMQIDAVVQIADRHRSRAALTNAAELTAAVADRDDAPALAPFMLGTIHEKLGDFAAAEAAYRRAYAIDPSNPAYANNLAMTLGHQGKSLDEAIALAQQVVEAEPSDADFFDTLAFVLVKAGRCDEALAAINRAIELDPQNPHWVEQRAAIREQCAPEAEATPADDAAP